MTSATELQLSHLQRVRTLEEAFHRLTKLLYDTSITREQMESEVVPHLSADVTFKDPWQRGVGKDAYRLGMAGFHAMFRFDFEVHQLNVSLAPDGRTGRTIVDGVMQLRQLGPRFTYPLRTILTFTFTVADPDQPAQFLVAAHEEMWSLADMIEAVPVLGRIYAQLFRPTFAKGFLIASRIASR
jgi:hypothetical protein